MNVYRGFASMSKLGTRTTPTPILFALPSKPTTIIATTTISTGDESPTSQPRNGESDQRGEREQAGKEMYIEERDKLVIR